MEKYKIATVCVSGVSAVPIGVQPIPRGIIGAEVEFLYDDDIWAGLRKKVAFRGTGEVEILCDGDTIIFPAEVAQRAKTRVTVGITGVNADGTEVIPTLWADLGTVRDSAYGDYPAAGEPELPVWAQLLAMIGTLANLNTEARENLVAAINEVLNKVDTGGGNADLSGYVKSINGICSNAEGNVAIAIPSKPEDIGALPDTYTPPIQTAEQVGADPKGTAAAAVSGHNTSAESHEDLRLQLRAINNRLTAFFDSDDQTLDELSEIVAYITSNKTLIAAITTSKVSVADIVDNLITNVSNKPLSAAQGVVLKGLIDTLQTSLSGYQPKGDYALRCELPTVPTKVSAFTNDAGYLTEHQDISGKLDASKLPEAVNEALAKAKASGEFDGAKGDPGSDYVITDADKDEILSVVHATANQQTPLFANSIAECTDTTKVYVLPDGFIYGYVLTDVPEPTITIEEHTDGYWVSGPKFTSGSGYYSKSTNMIPVTPGDQLEYTGLGASQAISVAWFDVSQTQISTAQYHNNWNHTTVTLTVPAGAAFARFFSFKQTSAISNVKLSVTWILCQAAGKKYDWASTGHAFVPADYENRIIALESSIGETSSVLKGKKIVYDGDSICESRTGSSANNGGGYAKLIADRVGGTYVNHAVGGARLTTASGASYHSVVDNLPNLPKDGDLYCFEGGINDYWTPKAIGTFDKTDFIGTLDTNTICGALETIFRYALSNFVGKPICFVIVHKIQSTAFAENSNGDTFEDYRNAIAGICNKYSIPYYDAFSESGLNGWNTAQNNAYLTSNTSGTADGTHPNENGYKRYYVPQLISLFEKIMPVAQCSPFLL